MRILMIGGTAFVGRHMAAAALDAGHDVTLFHRGKTGTDLFPQATHLTGDRDEDMSVLADGSWDATIDVCAYFPRQVRSLATALRGARRHVRLHLQRFGVQSVGASRTTTRARHWPSSTTPKRRRSPTRTTAA